MAVFPCTTLFRFNKFGDASNAYHDLLPNIRIAGGLKREKILDIDKHNFKSSTEKKCRETRQWRFTCDKMMFIVRI